MPLNLNEIDEVWLGLQQASSNLIADGHGPKHLPIDGRVCLGCYTLGLVKNAMTAYRKRLGLGVEVQVQEVISLDIYEIKPICAHNWNTGYVCTKCGTKRVP